VKNYESDREQVRANQESRQKHAAYRSIQSRLYQIRLHERHLDAQARARTGITSPARLYGVPSESLPPAFHRAMARIWSIGARDQYRVHEDRRRVYLLIAKGKAPLTVQDVIYLGQLPDAELFGSISHCRRSVTGSLR